MKYLTLLLWLLLFGGNASAFFGPGVNYDSIAYSQNYQFLTYFIPCPVSIKTEKRPPKSCLGVFKRDENSYEYDFHNLAPIDAKYDEGPRSTLLL